MDRTPPRVTVLMPVYNGEQCLAEAIDSILAQTYPHFELLIINDGSKDRSAQIIDSYADPRIRLVNNEQNIGLVATLNKGLDLAQGEFIARMDQDDISLPHRLQTQVDYMDRNPQVGLCGAWIEVFGIGNYVEMYPTDSDAIKASLLFYNVLAHPTVMMRREMLERFGLRYDMEYLHAEDHDLWHRCSACFEVVNLGQVLLKYRTSAASYCRVFAAEQAATLRRIDRRSLELLGIHVVDEQLDLQRDLRDMKGEPNHGQLKRIEQWLIAMVAANDATRYCQKDLFAQVVGAQWFRACRHASRLGLATWYRFIVSPLSQSPKDRRQANIAFLFAACCLGQIRPFLGPFRTPARWAFHTLKDAVAARRLRRERFATSRDKAAVPQCHFHQKANDVRDCGRRSI